jgi:hypothetical protein
MREERIRDTRRERVRDRDPAGRPRNARPRDAYGSPLPRDAADADAEPTMPEDIALTPAETLVEAQRLLDADRPFHAHEVLEAAWKSGPEGERDLWQGLAQLAVGLTHARRGNARGAVALLQRGADRIAPYAVDQSAPQSAPHSTAEPEALSEAQPEAMSETRSQARPAAPAAGSAEARDTAGTGTGARSAAGGQPGTGPYGIDVPGLVAHAGSLAARIGSDGLDALADADLRLRLTAH